MTDLTYLENLYAGYLQTGSLYARFPHAAEGNADRLQTQLACLAGMSAAMQGAERVRLYGVEADDERPVPPDVAQHLTASGGAYDLDFSSSPGLLAFLADRGRVLAELAGHPQVMPAYGNLLCFFSHKDSIPFSWYKRDASLLYYVKPTKGMDRRAASEMKRFLQSNPDGCVLSIMMESLRSNVVVFPGPEAAEHVWLSLIAIARNSSRI